MPRFQVRDFGNCLQFPSNGSYVTIVDATSLKPSVFSVCAWIMPSNFDANDYQNNFISKENNGSPQGFAFRCGGGKLNFTIGNGSSNPQAEATAPNIFSALWQHVAATYDGTNITVYINGNQVAQNTSASGYVVAAVPFRVGRSATFTSRDFYGYVDEVMYFNAALTQTQIQNIYYLGSGYPSANLLLYWKFDDGSGTSASDSSGNSNTGTLTAGSGLPQWSTNTFMKPRTIVS